MRAIGLDTGFIVTTPELARAKAATGVSVDILWDKAIDALEHDWRALEMRAAGVLPFNRFDVLKHWRASFAVGPRAVRPFAVAVHHSGQLVALLPLSLRRAGPLRIAEWMGEPIAEYGDALIAHGPGREAWLDAAFTALQQCKRIDAVCLRKVRADAAIAPMLARVASQAGPQRMAPVIELADLATHEDLHASLRPKLRKEIRRQRNKLASLGALHLDVRRGGPEAGKAVQDALALKRDWLQARGKISRAFADTRSERALVAMASDRTLASNIVTSRLTVDGRTAAVELGFVTAGRYYAFMGAFETELAAHSPGTVQMDETLAWCIGEGLQAYDLFAPADAYKLRWTQDAVGVADHVLVRNLPGRAWFVWSGRVRPYLKQVHEAMPGKMRRLANVLISAV